MKNLKIISLLFAILTIFISDVQAQDTIEDKIQKILELTGAKEQFNLVIDQLITLEQENNQILDESFFDKFRERAKEKGFDEISRKLMPVYLKHFTEEEIDGLIEFYESDIGKSLIKKTPLIMSESMEIGAEWGGQIGKEIAEEVFLKSKEEEQVELEQKFNLEIEEDCTKFKEGKFMYYLPDNTEIEFTRKKNKQIEIFDEKVLKYKIKWISNNRYTLTGMQKSYKNAPSDILTVNIYSVTKNSYKYISKMEGVDMYVDGEIIKKE